MTNLRKAAGDLLGGVEAAIKAGDWKVDGACDPDSAIVRLRQALAQPEQEPVAWFVQYTDSHEFLWDKPKGWRVKQALEIDPLYTAPPKREWVGLTDEEIIDRWPCETRIEFARWVEAKLKEKNGG